MDRFVDYSKEKISLIKKKTLQIQEMLNMKQQLEMTLTHLYNEHHSNIHLIRLDKSLKKIKALQFEDSEGSIKRLREYVCDLNCELLLISILFYPDVGEDCEKIRKLTKEFLLKLDNIRDSYQEIEEISYILLKIPM